MANNTLAAVGPPVVLLTQARASPQKRVDWIRCLLCPSSKGQACSKRFSAIGGFSTGYRFLNTMLVICPMSSQPV